MQQIGLDVLIGLCNDLPRAVLLEQARHDQRRLKVLADGDKADVEIVHAERADDCFIRTVADARIGETVGKRLDQDGILVHDHHVVAEQRQLMRQMASHSTHADNQYRFHNILL